MENILVIFAKMLKNKCSLSLKSEVMHKLQTVHFTASRDASAKVWCGTVSGCQEGSQGCSIWNISTYQHSQHCSEY
jgi:hypothetical protein